MKYIIEHLEPEMYEWCVIEYRHMSEIVGKDNLIFTNLKDVKGKEKLTFGKIEDERVENLKFDNICILDPNAEKALTSNDKFNYLIFGGILGDHPPKERTKIELIDRFKKKGIKFETRNLGKEQMSTDTALLVAKKITDGIKLSEIKFKDTIIIETGENEEVELPFRYVMENDKPVISKELVEYLKREDVF